MRLFGLTFLLEVVVVVLVVLSHEVSSFSMIMKIPTTNVGQGKTNVIAGATGYIGKSVVRESVRQGYNTIALVRDKSKVTTDADGQLLYGDYFQGATVVECDVCNVEQLTKVRTYVYLSIYLSIYLCTYREIDR
jgi:FlaA1/EpsC-like NDP-sugar epimerase